jgi:hypothetical protein
MAAVGAHAGDLDTAQQFYFKVRDCLGEVNFTNIDTLEEVRSAVNAGLWAVSTQIGVVGYDTVTIVANTFFYALNDNYMEKGLPHLPFKVKRITGDGTQVIGISEIPSAQFFVGLGTTIGPGVAGYSISGNRFWICPAEAPGDKIYIEGPINATPHNSSTQVESVIPEADRWAVVYYAVSILARARPSPENIALADYYALLWDKHVAARAGDYRRGKGEK